jgi:class 3 adenylate cyclase/pimeloyl-ACP methyl ester carboxylesterase
MPSQVPETRYVKSGDVNIAYQVVGDGPLDLVFVPAFVSHVELIWEEPLCARFLLRLAAFSRLILLDKSGTGLSDPVPVTELPDLERRMDDLRAVMDDIGSERASLFGWSDGGPMCALFAATYPDRTAALVLFSTFPRAIQDADFPEGWLPAEAVEESARAMEREWREGDFAFIATEGLSEAEENRVRRWAPRYMRMAASPGAAVAAFRMGVAMDVRDVLPVIRVPTLVLARAGEENRPAMRYMADHISGARYVEIPGNVHWPFLGGDQEVILGEIQEFLTGVRPLPEPDRVLATVLFTDIVGATERAAALGDRAWSDLLGRHHAVVRDALVRFGGTEVDTAGDGFFASFDGPARAIRCACAVVGDVRELGLDVRAGLHTGECELVEGKVAGIAVHTGARVASHAQPGEVLVSSTVKDLVAGSGLSFHDRGTRELKGIPGEWRLFAVSGVDASG